MTNSTVHAGATAPARFPRRTLGILWIVATLWVVALSLLLPLSDWPTERFAGLVMLALAVLGAASAVGVLRTGRRARRLSLVSSAAFVIGGVATAVIVSLDGTVFLSDMVMIGGVAALGGLVTGIVAARSPA